MLTLAISVLVALPLCVLSLVVASKVISDGWARVRFEKLSRGMPMFSGARLIGNHTSAIVFGENNCEIVRLAHEKLGNTFGALMGSKFGVSTIDLNLIKTIIQDEPDAHLNRNSIGLPLEEFEKSIMLAHKDEWLKVRPIIGAALTSSKFKTPNVKREIETSIDKLIDHIDRKLASQESNHLFVVDEFVHKYTLDLVFKCFFKQEGLIDFDDPNDLWTNSNEHAREGLQTSVWIKISVLFPQFSTMIDWLIWNFTPEGLGRRKILEFTRLQANLGMRARRQLQRLRLEAEKTGTKVDANNIVLDDGTEFKRNMIDHVIDKCLDGKLTEQQYFNNTAFLLLAGEKTAFDSIVHTIYCLSIDIKVQDELRNSIKLNGVDSEYLDWVIKESLRLLPPAPIGCSRTVGRDIEIEDGRYIVPSGSFVLTNAYVIHRLKKFWGDDADEFKPERWRDTTNHHPLQYIPFGAGKRGCPGKMFALHEMKMLLAVLITRYEFRGKPRDDVYKFNSPAWIYLLPNSKTKVTIKRL